jgi:serine/threonine protein kinase
MELSAENVQVGKEIGTGATGSVYKCRLSTSPGAVYAVKSFHSHALGPRNTRRQRDARATALATLRKELEVLRTLPLPHENIVSVIGAVQTDEITMIVMELLDGSLADHMEEKLDAGAWYAGPEILDMSRQLSNGLRFLHQNSFCHRDIKVRPSVGHFCIVVCRWNALLFLTTLLLWCSRKTYCSYSRARRFYS